MQPSYEEKLRMWKKLKWGTPLRLTPEGEQALWNRRRQGKKPDSVYGIFLGVGKSGLLKIVPDGYTSIGNYSPDFWTLQ